MISLNSGGNGAAINQLSDGTLIANNFHWKHVPLSRKDKLQGLGGYREQENLGLAAACEGVFTTRSSDNGYTWESPQKMETPGFQMSTTAGRILELKNHSLLAPLNGKKADDASNRCWVMQSADAGLTWKYLATVAYAQGEIDFHELRILLLPSGRILAMMRTPKTNFYQSHSDDEGRTWSPTEETPIWCGGSSPADLLLLECVSLC